MLVVQAHQIHALGGGQRGDGGGGSAGHDESRVQLAVLQRVGAVAEALIGGVDVLLGQVIGAQKVDGVVVHAGAGGADGDVLALQVGNGLNVGVGGDDLHLLHVQVGHGGDVGNSAGFGKQVGARIRIGHDVGLDKAQLSRAVLQVLNVVLRAAGLDGDNAHAGIAGDILAQHAAERIVCTLRTAGREGQRISGAGCGTGGSCSASGTRRRSGSPIVSAAGEDRGHHQCGHEKRHQFFHRNTPFLSFNLLGTCYIVA
ncbi:hypothetical protein SDC9_133621 [bioreactor metagenome]|uniref:Uncharacterized protein n=1 Tax=bioreactor metagenome TaxID=1076179 RepID=A0A645DD95_9ZZZZ